MREFKIKFYYYKIYDDNQYRTVFRFFYGVFKPCVVFVSRETYFYVFLDLSDYFSEEEELVEGTVFPSCDLENRPVVFPKFDYNFEMTFSRSSVLNDDLSDDYFNSLYDIRKNNFFCAVNRLIRVKKIIGLISERKEEFKEGIKNWNGKKILK